MSSSPSFPFDDLPYELQKEVFTLAAYSEPRSILRLVLVAQRVNIWIQPLLYEMVTLGAEDTHLFIRTARSKPPEFFATSVKRLCLSVSVSAENAILILKFCTGVISLALWVDFLGTSPQGSVSRLISPFSLRRLSIEYSHMLDILRSPVSPNPTWYETLTHLDIIFWTHEESPSFEGLQQLISLTHLALGLRHSDVHQDSLSLILSTVPRLRILLILVEEGDLIEENFPSKDLRVLYMPYPASVVQNWEAPWRGFPDTWSKAEDMLQQKRATESDCSSPT